MMGRVDRCLQLHELITAESSDDLVLYDIDLNLAYIADTLQSIEKRMAQISNMGDDGK